MITNLILHLVNISTLASSLCVVSMTAYLQTKPETLANNQNSFKDFQQGKALVWMECTMSAAIKQHNYILIFVPWEYERHKQKNSCCCSL